MEFKVYGHAGKPVVVFPSQGGRFFEYEDFGMVGACNWFIEEGKIQLYTVDSIDNQSWANWAAHPADRSRRHNDYDWFITDELRSFIRENNPYNRKYMTTGCSMGAYHAGNFFFRHPDIFHSVIALSGLFRLNIFIGDYMDDNVYFNSPLAFLPNLSDPAIIDQYQDSKIIICSGQGAWEDAMLEDALSIKRILEEKGVSACVDVWGHDVNHDWPWRRHMMPYFLGKMDL